MALTIADAVWLATATLHRNHPEAIDFSVQQIIAMATQDNLVDRYRPGLQVHASKHCVANKSPNPGRYRMLFETTRGRRRLFRHGDSFHPGRQGGKVRPDKADLPGEYQALVDWYDSEYSKQPRVASQEVVASLRLEKPTPVRELSPAPGTALVGAAGALVIPEALRLQLGLREGTRLGVYREGERLILEPVTENFIHGLRGCCKGKHSLVEAREREHRMEK